MSSGACRGGGEPAQDPAMRSIVGWQGEGWFYLSTVLHDFSRYISPVKRLWQRKKSDLEGSPPFRLQPSIDHLGDLASLRVDEHYVLVHDTIAIAAFH